MKFVDCTTLYLPQICRELGYLPSPFAQCISCVEDGKLVAGVVYDGYNGSSISAHIWVRDNHTPSREWFAAIFDYPFNRLGVIKIVGQVNSSLQRARKLDEHFGFHLEATVKDFFTGGDLLVYTMTKDQCHVLSSPLWSKSVDKVRRV